MAEPTGKPQGGKEGEEDLSMEEILQSIRKIIAEDEDPAAPKPAAPEAVHGSDVLELSESADDSVLELSAELPPEPIAAAPAPAPAANDVLSRIDEALADPPPPPPMVESPKAAALAEDTLLSDKAASAAAASLEKLKVLEEKEIPMTTTPSPAFRSGNTVEDMVVDFLRPMMKEWLDTNLPNIVERVVEHEVKRLTRN